MDAHDHIVSILLASPNARVCVKSGTRLIAQRCRRSLPASDNNSPLDEIELVTGRERVFAKPAAAAAAAVLALAAIEWEQ